MSSEKNLIKLISGVMPKSPLQMNKLYESDSEIVDYKGSKLLFNIDEFSKEDMFREHNPRILGFNIATASISDILATGGTPLYYLHSMCVPSRWDENYIKSFSQGVAEALRLNNMTFLGGDFSKSEEWKYTATVVGENNNKCILRSGAKIGDNIYITGKIGTGNLEAFLKIKGINKFKLMFNSRHKESRFINSYATACIDTSDGCYNCLNTIAEMSNVGYEIEKVPYIRLGKIAAKLANVEELLLFLGECGEYELMFTIAEGEEENFIKNAKKNGFRFYRIGKIVETGTKIIRDSKRIIDFSNINISARDYENIEDYLQELIRVIKRDDTYGK
ncbi:MAG: hypothetical protein A2Y22_03685 [Clostridiales bacterium GWD2_32_59]|nr:MAG: hypothetical protein A2Y22_03685 [Clostridiales bacterium GWD2_32_59]